jgi:deoxyribonuclease V
MKISRLHDWNLSPKEAVALQRELADRVITSTPLLSWELVAGADVSYNRYTTTLYAGVVVLRATDLTVVERRGLVAETTFPYVPGLLSFRETPVVLEALAQLQHVPDVVMCDGQGYAHPRRAGLACHVGLWLDRPCLGCAKTLLVGEHDELGAEAGSRANLMDKDEVVGAAVRTKHNVNPVYVSPGHRIDLESAIRVVLSTGAGYRVPEPTRQAHLYVNELRRGEAVP